MKDIAKFFIEKTTLKKSNFFTIPGAMLLAFSFALPYFLIPYTMTSRTIAPLELVVQFFIFDNGTSLFFIIAILYLMIVALAAFFIPKRLTAFLSAGGIIILAMALYFSPISFERFCGGIVVSFAGLALLLSGCIGN